MAQMRRSGLLAKTRGLLLSKVHLSSTLRRIAFHQRLLPARFNPRPWPNQHLFSTLVERHAASGKGTLDDERKPIGSVTANAQGAMVSVTWSDDETQDYPFVWLLDNCSCSDCYHAGSQGRVLPFADLNIDARPESVETIHGGSALRVSWNRYHQSEFDSLWLRNNRFEKTAWDEISAPPQKLWGAEIADSLPRFDFQEVLSNDQVLYNFLKTVREYGIVMLENTPAEPGQIPKVASRIGPMTETGFGLIQHLKRGGHENAGFDRDRALSYTERALQLHTDFASLYESTYMSLFHCIKSAAGAGGDSIYSDGFKAAEALRRVDPEAFDLLSTIQLKFRLVGAEQPFGEFDLRTYHSPIALDPFGRLRAIYYSTHARLPSMRMSVDDVKPVYGALQTFVKLLEQPENVFQIKLQKGETMVTNNHRILHGRTAFHDKSERHLELGYVDVDQVTSRMRILRNKLHGGGSSD